MRSSRRGVYPLEAIIRKVTSRVLLVPQKAWNRYLLCYSFTKFVEAEYSEFRLCHQTDLGSPITNGVALSMPLTLPETPQLQNRDPF